MRQISLLWSSGRQHNPRRHQRNRSAAGQTENLIDPKLPKSPISPKLNSKQSSKDGSSQGGVSSTRTEILEEVFALALLLDAVGSGSVLLLAADEELT